MKDYHAQYFAHVTDLLHAITIIMCQMMRRIKYKCMFKESKILSYVLLCRILYRIRRPTILCLRKLT